MGELPGNYRINRLIDGDFVPECKEISEADAKYLAGIFEIAGGISIRPERKKDRPKYLNVRAKAYFNDNNEEKILSLEEKFGGMTIPLVKEHSWRWLAQGKNASNILRKLRPYAPYRRPQIDLFGEVCNDTTPITRKLEIADGFSGYIHDLKDYPNPSSYKELLADPNFLAGIYDGRGASYPGWKDDMLKFNSQNMGLMLALGNEFGVEAVPAINTRWQRQEGAFVPVSFTVQLHADAKNAFLARLPVAA